MKRLIIFIAIICILLSLFYDFRYVFTSFHLLILNEYRGWQANWKLRYSKCKFLKNRGIGDSGLLGYLTDRGRQKSRPSVCGQSRWDNGPDVPFWWLAFRASLSRYIRLSARPMASLS